MECEATNSVFDFILDFLDGDKILFNAISFIIGILGLFLTILGLFLTWRANKKREPLFAVRTTKLIKEDAHKISPIHINYLDKEINNLSISKIAFWNNGRETINSADVAKNNPLRIKIDDEYEILDCEIIYIQNTSNGFSVKLYEDRKNISIDFDYLDYNEGFIIQIYHTGNSSSNFSFLGQIKSCGVIGRYDPIRYLISLPKIFMSKRKISFRILGWGIFIIGIISLLMGVFYTLSNEAYMQEIFEVDRKISGMALIAISILYIYNGYVVIKKHVPKWLNIYED